MIIAWKSTCTPEGEILWTAIYGVQNEVCQGMDVTCDDDGNCYMNGICTGGFNGIIVASNYEAFVMKLNGNGGHVWTKALGSNGAYGYGIDVDSSGCIYITGETWNSFGQDGEKAFVAKYDTDGNNMWLKFIDPCDGGSCGFCLRIKDGDTIYLAGEAGGAEADGMSDMFVCELDVNGNVVWSSNLGDPFTHTYAQALIWDEEDNIYVSGTTFGRLNGQNRNGINDAFVAKFDEDGGLLWVRQNGYQNGCTFGYSVAVFSDQVFLGGKAGNGFEGEEFGVIHRTRGFIMEYNTQGDKGWSCTYNDRDTDESSIKGLMISKDSELIALVNQKGFANVGYWGTTFTYYK
jgi:hypothetical protein